MQNTGHFMPRHTRTPRHRPKRSAARPKLLVAVAGASGRLGLHVLRKLRSHRWKCVALVRSRAAAQKLPKGITWRLADYSDVDALALTLADVTHIVNCTGKPDQNSSLHDMMAANVLPTRSLLLASPAHLHKFVHISSISVYGWDPKAGANEFSPRDPDTPYAISKLEAEKLVLLSAHKRPVVVLQPGMIYGPDFHEGFWPALRMIMQGQMRILGNGQNRLPLVHVDDVASGIICALRAPVHSGSVFLLVSPEQITQEKAITAAAHELGVMAPQKKIFLHLARLMSSSHSFVRNLQGRQSTLTPEMVRQMSSDRFFDCSRARTLLHWRAAVPFKIGLKQVVSQFESSQRGESYG